MATHLRRGRYWKCPLIKGVWEREQTHSNKESHIDVSEARNCPPRLGLLCLDGNNTAFNRGGNPRALTNNNFFFLFTMCAQLDGRFDSRSRVSLCKCVGQSSNKSSSYFFFFHWWLNQFHLIATNLHMYALDVSFPLRNHSCKCGNRALSHWQC